MPARRRQIVSGQLYELEIRSRSGLPFPCLRLIRLLLASAMARSQRDAKVTICHFLWMSNHLHLLFIAKDSEACTQFYAELMKKITDYMKRLLGLDTLELWEPGGPVLSRVLDLNSALDRVAYLYANPSRADLVDSISDYPGFSSWKDFGASPDSDLYCEQVPWIRQPAISVLPSRILNERQDMFLTQKLRKSSKILHALTSHPNAFYSVFGVFDKQEILQLNLAILADITQREAQYADARKSLGTTAKGVNALKREPIMKSHKPKREPSDRKILFHTSCKALALEFLEQFNHFCEQCRDAYHAWRSGDYFATWPPGAFRPPLRPVACALALE